MRPFFLLILSGTFLIGADMKAQDKAIGHAVRANYLYEGAADLYIETGKDSLMTILDKIWHNMTQRKMYITGGCGALYDGVSPDSILCLGKPGERRYERLVTDK